MILSLTLAYLSYLSTPQQIKRMFVWIFLLPKLFLRYDEIRMYDIWILGDIRIWTKYCGSLVEVTFPSSAFSSKCMVLSLNDSRDFAFLVPVRHIFRFEASLDNARKIRFVQSVFWVCMCVCMCRCVQEQTSKTKILV